MRAATTHVSDTAKDIPRLDQFLCFPRQDSISHQFTNWGDALQGFISFETPVSRKNGQMPSDHPWKQINYSTYEILVVTEIS
jgi:hypothetical protein